MKKDKEVVMAAVQREGRALVYAAKEMKHDKEVVMAAVLQDGPVLCHQRDEEGQGGSHGCCPA